MSKTEVLHRREHNGDLHIGVYKEGRKNGFGIVLKKNGTLIAADFLENQMEGLCIVLDASGRKYLGTMKQGVREKFGMMSTQDSLFRGHFQENIREGIGLNIRTVEGGYEMRAGTYEKDQMKGYCEVYRTDMKYEYMGFVEDELPEGIGLEKIGNEEYLGSFVRGNRDGVGEMVRGDLSYKGMWVRGNRDGFGIEKYRKVESSGFFERGVLTGLAEIRGEDGSKYLGEVKKGMRSGFGQMKGDFGLYIGDWKNNQRDGIGFEKDSQGEMYLGKWVRDKREVGGVNWLEEEEDDPIRDNFLSNGSILVGSGSKLYKFDPQIRGTVENKDYKVFFETSKVRIREMGLTIQKEKHQILQESMSIIKDFGREKEQVDEFLDQVDYFTVMAELGLHKKLMVLLEIARGQNIDIEDSVEKILSTRFTSSAGRIDEPNSGHLNRNLDDIILKESKSTFNDLQFFSIQPRSLDNGKGINEPNLISHPSFSPPEKLNDSEVSRSPPHKMLSGLRNIAHVLDSEKESDELSRKYKGDRFGSPPPKVYSSGQLSYKINPLKYVKEEDPVLSFYSKERLEDSRMSRSPERKVSGRIPLEQQPDKIVSSINEFEFDSYRSDGKKNAQSKKVEILNQDSMQNANLHQGIKLSSKYNSNSSKLNNIEMPQLHSEKVAPMPVPSQFNHNSDISVFDLGTSGKQEARNNDFPELLSYHNDDHPRTPVINSKIPDEKNSIDEAKNVLGRKPIPPIDSVSIDELRVSRDEKAIQEHDNPNKDRSEVTKYQTNDIVDVSQESNKTQEPKPVELKVDNINTSKEEENIHPQLDINLEVDINEVLSLVIEKYAAIELEGLETEVRQVLEMILEKVKTPTYLFSEQKNILSDLSNQLKLETLRKDKALRKLSEKDKKEKEVFAKRITEVNQSAIDVMLKKKKELEGQLKMLDDKIKVAKKI